MKKSKFTQPRVIAVLKAADAGMKVEELCRKHGISPATYDNWKAKYEYHVCHCIVQLQ